MLQNLLISSAGFLDIFMLGQLGEEAISSVVIVNQYSFVFSIIMTSIGASTSIFTSRYWSSKSVNKLLQILRTGLLIGLIISSLTSIIVLFFPRAIITLFTDDITIIDIGIEYIRTIAPSYIFMGLSIILSSFSRSIKVVKLPLFASIYSVFVNVLLNYILIFGKVGFPELGVLGAAIATLISKGLELLIIVLACMHKSYPIRFMENKKVLYSKELIRSFIKVLVVGIAQVILWALGIAVYNAIYSRMGKEAFSAISIAVTIESIAFVFISGLVSSIAIMIGHSIGSKNREETIKISISFIKIALILALLLSLFMFLIRDSIVNYYNVSDIVKTYISRILIFYSVMFIVKSVNMVLMSGIMKSGGDVNYMLVISLVSMWIFGIPAVSIGTFLFQLPIYFVAALTLSEELAKLILSVNRYKSNKWIKKL